MRRPVVLDTDLGSDVDDALALAVLLGSPELDLLGVTTVYGDVVLRARLAAGFAALAGRGPADPLPVIPGSAEPLSGKPVWVSGEEGKHFPDLTALSLGRTPASAPTASSIPSVSMPNCLRAGMHDHDGVCWLLEQAELHAGELEIVAIGPLTNLARAVRADPEFGGRIARVWMMGGLFGDGPPEHNFASDAVAADLVLRSGLPITVLGVELTRQLRLADAEVTEIGRAGALGAQLERETRAWMAYWDEPFDVPHDAVAVIRMLRPDLFTGLPIRVRVEPGGESAGLVGLDQSGSVVEIVTGLDIPAVTREILDRIRAASSTASSVA
jgi:purine nucleosidase